MRSWTIRYCCVPVHEAFLLCPCGRCVLAVRWLLFTRRRHRPFQQTAHGLGSI